MRLSNSMIGVNSKTPNNSQVAMQSSVRSGMGRSSLLLGCHPPVRHFFFHGVLYLPMSVVFLLNPLTPIILYVALLPVPYLALAWTFSHCNSNWICKTKPRKHKLAPNLAHRPWNSSMGVTGHYFLYVLDSLALSDFSVHSTSGHILSMLLWEKKKGFFSPYKVKDTQTWRKCFAFCLTTCITVRLILRSW